MKTRCIPRPGWRFAAALALLSLAGCGALSPTTTPPPAFYALDSLPVAQPPQAAPAAPASRPPALPAAAPTLVVNPPRAAAGFDSQRIIYVREPHKLEYFANSEWVEPPARMLGTLLVAALENSRGFSAVVLAAGSAAGDLRLDTEVVRLQQEFQTRPSRVAFTLRATLVDDKTRRVLAVRQFDAAEAAPSEDAYGGVVAANRAVRKVLDDLALFCRQAATQPRSTK
jgi:cholesterol transport system auxiliary component